MSRNLIAFYSRANENYVNGTIKQLTVGNTEVAAGIIKEFIDADIFKIEQKQAYSENYKQCVTQAKIDKEQNARPELKTYLDSISEYDTIYLGFPNYCGTMPMAVFTFLEHYDFTGKKIKPFCTNEGSGMGLSEKDLKNLCPKAKVEKGLAIMGNSVDKSADAIEKWLKE